jgi:mannose-6-phosphate isomerase-like protein (cupin superfamily)
MSNQHQKISIPRILPQITTPWSPKLLANLNGEYDFKISKLRGAFVFHSHPDTDELFYILSGTLVMRMKEPGNEESQEREDVTVCSSMAFNDAGKLKLTFSSYILEMYLSYQRE